MTMEVITSCHVSKALHRIATSFVSSEQVRLERHQRVTDRGRQICMEEGRIQVSRRLSYL